MVVRCRARPTATALNETLLATSVHEAQEPAACWMNRSELPWNDGRAVDVLAALTDDFLEEHFAPETLERARGYLDRIDGPPHLQQLSAGIGDGDGVRLRAARRRLPRPAALRGRPAERPQPGAHERVDLQPLHLPGAQHVQARRRGRPEHARGPRLRASGCRSGSGGSASLVEDLSRTADRDVEPFPLALQFTLERPAGLLLPRRRPLLCVRPLRPGAKQAWIKVRCRLVRHPGRGPGPEPAARAGRRHRRPAQRRCSATAATTSAGTAPTLAQFGPHLPRLLRAAEAAGVEFVPVPPLTAVTIREKPVGLDGRDHQRRRAWRGLTLGVDVDGELWRGERVRFVGNDRIVALLDDGHLQIAELDRDVPTVARRLIEDDPLEVPAAELDAFRARLAGLLRHLTVRSPDGSVDVPAPVRPDPRCSR